MAKLIVASLIAWTVLAVSAAALGAPLGGLRPYGGAPTMPPPAVAMQNPVDYSNAGISIAVPQGFLPKLISAPFDVMSAAIEEANRPVEAITLSAFPIVGTVLAEEFAEGKMSDLQRNLAIRNLKTLRKTPMPVAGATGAARLVTYSFRGTQSVAAQVYFIRDIPNNPNRICYLLTVVTSLEKQAALLPALGAVIKSVSFTPLKEPEIPAKITLEEPARDLDLGFSIRLPKGWYIDRSGAGVEAGLVNYLQGGIPMPSIKVVAAPASVDAATSEACSKKLLAMLQSGAVRNKQETRTVSDGKTMLGDLPAWQFVLQIVEKPNPTPSLGSTQPGDLIIINRTACLNVPGKQPIAYTVTITAKATEQVAAGKLIDAMAGTFKAIGPATQPATSPAATQPATAAAATIQPRPATQPATSPAATQPATAAAATKPAPAPK